MCREQFLLPSLNRFFFYFYCSTVTNKGKCHICAHYTLWCSSGVFLTFSSPPVYTLPWCDCVVGNRCAGVRADPYQLQIIQ